MIDRLRPRWKLLLAVTVLSAVAIQAFEVDHNRLQLADDDDHFRHILDRPGRAMAAALSDVIFAAAYGLLGVVGLRVVAGRTRTAAIGAVAIAGGALFDEIENAVLIRNIAVHETLTDGWIDAMQVPGTLKWVSAPAFLLLLGLLVTRAVRRRRHD